MPKRSLLFFCIVVFIASTAYAAPSKKPQPPVFIAISPAQKDLTPDRIQPGDRVELIVVATSRMDADKLNVHVDLMGGTKLISGETEWTGAVQKNSEIRLNITVQAPRTATGAVKARATIHGINGASFSAEARYVLGIDKKKKSSEKPSVKKDSKGRNIREYE